MNRRMRGLIFFITIFCLVVGVACAWEIRPLADSEFDFAYPALLSNKSVEFSALTYDVKNSISVSNCRLEEKISEHTWMGIPVPSPSYVATNTFGYSATEDYSAYIDTGTYRFYATFNADGHSITRSSERTY